MAKLEPVSIEERNVRFGEVVFTYRLARERRRTLVMRIEPEGLVLHAPLSAPVSRVEEFIGQKRGWIEKHLTRLENDTQTWTALFQFRHGGRFLFRGCVTGLMLGAKKTALVRRGGFDILRAALPTDASPVRVRGFLRGWLAAQAARTFPVRATALAMLAGDKPSAVCLSDATTYWGRCDSRGVILLSWRLVLFDDALRDYVIAHELAHLSYMDHSERFWAHVAAIDPECRSHANRLKRVHIREIPL